MQKMRFISRSATILACAAAFSLTPAQWGWSDDDSGSSPWGSSESTPEPSPSSGESSPYDIGGGAQSDGSFSSAFGGSDEQEPPAATESGAAAGEKPQRERRPARERPSPGSTKFAGSQKTCPVCSSVRLKNHLYAVGGGKKIHVCSDACLHRVRRNPPAFIGRMDKRGEQLAGQ